MKINPNVSIFIQLANQIRYEIYSRKRLPGSKVESIREMALKLEVNPNTIKRVFKVLEEEGLIYSKSTLGYFVVEDVELIKYNRDIFIENRLTEFLEVLKKCHVDKEDIIEIIKGEERNGLD